MSGEEGGGKVAGKLHRIDFVRSGEIGVCFTAHLAETVEDVKTIKKDKPGTILFFVEKRRGGREEGRRRRNKEGEERKGKEEREKKHSVNVSFFVSVNKRLHLVNGIFIALILF